MTKATLTAIVYIRRQGYGHMPCNYYDQLPPAAKARVTILAVAPSPQKAEFICSFLPTLWHSAPPFRIDEQPTEEEIYYA